MKTLFLNLVLISMIQIISAQNKAIDKLFDKYADREGFSTVLISKDMFKLFSDKKGTAEMQQAIEGLESIRILTSEGNQNVNFFNELQNDIPFSEYTTLMSIKEKGQQMKMMVKEGAEGHITEFLMIGGGQDNVLISIVGDIDMRSLSQISNGLNLNIPDVNP